MLRFVLRTCVVLWLILTFLAPDLLGRPIRPEDLHRANRYCRRLARAMGWRLRRHGDLSSLADGLVVMNHLSWIDPLLIAALMPMRFVTSLDTGAKGLIGSVARRGGCVFVDRRSTTAVASDREILADHLRTRPITVFPEATSSDGSRVLPFKPACFQSALDAGASVHPLAIRYASVNGRTPSMHRRRTVCWYGDMHFFPHLARLMTLREVTADLHLGPDLRCPSGMDRKTLATLAREQVVEGWERLRER